jgi:EpsI family protein
MGQMMPSYRTAFIIAGLMIAASVGAVIARPSSDATSPEPVFLLEAMIPKHFGDWREEPQGVLRVINPQAQTQLNEIYSQTLSRTYVNGEGYQIMLSLAYGPDQRGHLGAHDPEVCYPASGFTVRQRIATKLATFFGEIPVRRLFMTRGSREEPITYWFRIGDKAVTGWQRRLVELGYSLSGRIPDGMLFRVSSLDPDQTRANRLHDQFINQLLETVSPTERKHLSGLGDS